MASNPVYRRFTKEQLDQFRGKIYARKAELVGVEQDLEDEGLSGLSMETTDEISHIRTHAADLGTEEFERGLALNLAEGEIKELQDIEDALIKMQNETYGICRECGCEIPTLRLEALPYTRYCGPCQMKLEKRNRDEAHKPASWP